MEPVNNDGMCRCCASEGTFKDLQSTYLWMGIGEVYSDMIKDCFDISLSTSISGNGGICEVCITQLRNACNFKKQVEQTEEQFRRRLADSEFRADVVKIEVPPDVEGHDADNDPFEGTVSGEFSRPANVLKIEVPPDDEDHDADNDPFEGTMSDEFSGPEYDIPLKNIKIEKEIEKPKKRAAKPSTSKAKKPKAEDGEPSVKRTLKIKLEKPETRKKVIVLVLNKEKSRQEKSKSKVNLVIKSEKQTRKAQRAIQGKEQGLHRAKSKAVKDNIVINNAAKIELSKHFNNIKEILQWSNATPLHFNSVGYICCFCKEPFQDSANLKTHTIENHRGIAGASFTRKRDLVSYNVKVDISNLQCNICNRHIDNIDNLIEHLITAHGKNLYTDIKNHIIPFKFNGDVLQCFFCLNTFNKFKCLSDHMNIHLQNFKCEFCDAAYVNRQGLRMHSDKHKLGTFKCELCPKVFDNLGRKKSHVNNAHSLTSHKNKCGYCEETFKDYRKKERHIFTVHNVKSPALKCNACDRTFKTQNAFNVHTKRYHLMERRHNCEHCSMKFFSSNELKEHKLTHTGIKTFQCDVCLKFFGRKYTLTEHLRVHAGDRRYKCERCGQAFIQKCSWRGHVRNKHGEDV